MTDKLLTREQIERLLNTPNYNECDCGADILTLADTALALMDEVEGMNWSVLGRQRNEARDERDALAAAEAELREASILPIIPFEPGAVSASCEICGYSLNKDINDQYEGHQRGCPFSRPANERGKELLDEVKNLRWQHKVNSKSMQASHIENTKLRKELEKLAQEAALRGSNK